MATDTDLPADATPRPQREVRRARIAGVGWIPLLVSLGSACSSDSSTPTQSCTDTEGCGSTGDSGAADEGPAASTGGQDDGAASGEIPCEVQDVLNANCGTCHGDPVQFGASMPLRTIEDFRVPAVSDPTTPVAQLVLSRMVDPDRPMPADSSLSDDDRRVIEAWIAADMPAEQDADSCEGVADDGGEPWGPEALPCEPDIMFLANDSVTDGGFEVPEVDDLYQCFAFDSPFTEDTQGIAWAPVIDDARVVHHWLLLRGDGTTEDGNYPCSDNATETSMIMGWAPGTPNFIMPDEAGLELPGPGEKVILQIHYNNSAAHTDVADRSGVALCTTEEPREQAAGTLWLGSLQIEIPPGETAEVTHDCDTTRLEEPVNLLLDWPHMHELGSSIKTELIPGDGGEPETLVDVPNWNFENQIYYPHAPPVRIEPGDQLRTTCTFDNTTDQHVSFGSGTADEMCYDFAIVYPITAFDAENPLGAPELGRYCVDLGFEIPFP